MDLGSSSQRTAAVPEKDLKPRNNQIVCFQLSLGGKTMIHPVRFHCGIAAGTSAHQRGAMASMSAHSRKREKERKNHRSGIDVSSSSITVVVPAIAKVSPNSTSC